MSDKELQKIPKTVLRFIHRKFKHDEIIELIIGSDGLEKKIKQIVKNRESQGYNQIISTDKLCPKCQKAKLDNLGLFRAYGGVYEFFRCEKCRYLESKLVLPMNECPKCGRQLRKLTREECGEKTQPTDLTEHLYCDVCKKTIS